MPLIRIAWRQISQKPRRD